MLANDARKIALNNQQHQIEIWWVSYKEKLFKRIHDAALIGKLEITITDNDKLNENKWIESQNTCKFVKKELTELGYTFKEYEDRGDFKVSIQW